MVSLLTEWHRNGFPISPYSGRPVQFDETQLHVLIKEEPCQITRELAWKMASSHVIVTRHLHLMGKAQKHDMCATRIDREKETTVLFYCHQFIHLTPSYSWIQRKIPLPYYHRERKMVSLCEYEAEKRMGESLQAGHTHNLL